MPTMNVSLTPEFAAFVDEAVASGDYVSASEVVREALRVLRDDKESEEAKLALLKRAVGIGLAQSAQGNFSDRSVGDIFADAIDGA